MYNILRISERAHDPQKMPCGPWVENLLSCSIIIKNLQTDLNLWRNEEGCKSINIHWPGSTSSNRNILQIYNYPINISSISQSEEGSSIPLSNQSKYLKSWNSQLPCVTFSSQGIVFFTGLNLHALCLSYHPNTKRFCLKNHNAG